MGPAGNRAARVNSSDIRNKFWCNITVLNGLVIVLSLLISFNQCTLLIQHKPQETHAAVSVFALIFTFVASAQNPLMQKYMSRTTGIFFSKVNSIYASVAINSCFCLQIQNTGDSSVFSRTIPNRKPETKTQCLDLFQAATISHKNKTFSRLASQ